MRKPLQGLLPFSSRKNVGLVKKTIQTALLFLSIIFFTVNQVAAQKIQASALRQIQSLLDEKASRTPAQKKINSQILYAFKMRNGQAITSEVNTLETGVTKDVQGRIKVELDAVVSPSLLQTLKNMGSEIIFSSEKYGDILANIPLDKVEQVAALDAVKHIDQWSAPMNNSDLSRYMDNYKKNGAIDRSPIKIPEKNNDIPSFNLKYAHDFAIRAANVRKQLEGALNNTAFNGNGFFSGSVTSEADVTHKAALARAVFGTNGSGVKIGVISNGVDGYASSQASGDLPPVIHILPGQASTGSEGRAMMELVYDIAPGADLYFATGNPTPAQFAQNILDLRAAGCDIIVDDLTYFNEGVFQDDIIAQAVNTVTASGALYFSAAGNSGNEDDHTSGVWEGDFVDGGSSSAPLPLTGNLHNFSGSTLYNILTLAGRVTLKWSDPLGASGNDYDLFATNSAGTAIVASSTNVQDGNDIPYEDIGNRTAGQRIYILKKTGAAVRALHLNTNRGMLTFHTPGVMFGHNAAATAYTVAATPAYTPFGLPPNPTGPYPGVFNAGNKVEIFSSDGPRKMFYNPDGSPITPGNVLFGTGGGTVLQKPDITGADGATTVTPGFIPFYGTSAAAPHSAAIAALIKSALPSLTPAQIRNALTSTAIDIEGPGADRDAGAGIIMAYEALQAAGATPVSNVGLGTVTTVEGTYGNGNGILEPGELGSMTIQLVNASPVTSTNVNAILTTSTPGITITQNTANYGDIIGLGSTINTGTPYGFSVYSSVPCGTVINFQLTVTYGGGGMSPQTFNFTVTAGASTGTITATFGSPVPTGTGYVSSSGTQINRLNRNGIISTCAAPKATPILQEALPGASRAYHAYTFTNSGTASQCVTVSVSSSAVTSFYEVVYGNGGYIPTSIQTNYLADQGTTTNASAFSFNASPGQQFTVVVHEVTAGGAAGVTYNLNISLQQCAPVAPCVLISPVSIPGAVAGVPYSQTFNANGGSNNFTFSETGTLPAGLTFSGNTISGTPTQTGNFPISITVTDPACPVGASNNYTLTIACQPIAVTNPAVTTAAASLPFSQTFIQISGIGTTTFSTTSTLPAGLTLSSAGVLSGTPTQIGTFPITVKATDANGCTGTGDVYNLTVQGIIINASSPVVITSENAVPLNNAPDPGETLTVNLPLINIGNVNTTDLVATLQSTGGVTNQSGPQHYGAVVGGGSPVAMPYTFTATGICGGSIVLTLTLQDGATNLGTISYTLTLGTTGTVSGSPVTFTNSTAIAIPLVGAASPYPSNIVVSGLTGPISKLTVKLKQFSHTFSSDVAVLLVSPAGQKMVIMSGTGSNTVSTNVDLVLDDAAASSIPNTVITSGTFKPTSYSAITFPSGPATPYLQPATVGTATLTSAFNGQNPNGTWSLYVTDAFTPDQGSFSGGWELNITTLTPVCSAVPSVINTGTPTGTITACAGSASADPHIQQFTVSGNFLPTDITVNAPTNFEVSISAGSGYSSSLNLTQTGGTVPNTIIYVRSAASAPAGPITGNVTLTSGAITGSVAVSGTVNPIPDAVATPSSQTLNCGAGTITTIVLSGSVSGTAFNWTRDNTTTVTGIAGNGSGNISGSLVNTTRTPITVTFTITPTANGCDGAAITATVTVNPDITAPAAPASLPDVHAECLVTLNPPTALDDCAGSIVGTTTTVFPVTTQGTTIVTWTFDDGHGNTSSVTQNIIIQDVTPPIIFCPANITVNNTAGQCGANVTFAATASDNCSGAFVTYDHTPGSSFPTGTTTVVATAHDAVGHTATCTFTVKVVDAQGPTITCPSNITQAVSGNTCSKSIAVPNPTVSDNCGVAKLTWTMTGTTTGSSPSTGTNYVGTKTFNTGTTTITYTATDINGNASQCSFTVKVTESVLPTIACPSNKTVAADYGFCSWASKNLTTPTVSDNCGVASVTNNAPVLLPLGATVVTWTVTDNSGNTRTCSQTITVVDNQPPSVTSPANIYMDASSSCITSVTAPNATYYDNCTVAKLTWVMTGATTGSSPTTGINFVGTKNYNVGTTTITYTVKDASGNSASSSFAVIITDKTKPSLTCPANITQTASNGSCSRSIAVPDPAYSDNCGVTKLTWFMAGATSTSSLMSGINKVGTKTFNVGVTTITYSVYDAAGNTVSCTFTVTVTDNQFPVVSCPSARTLCKVNNNSYSIPAMTESDNCGIATTTYKVTGVTTRNGTGTNASGTFNLGLSTITWTVTDFNGNVTTCSTNVTIVTAGNCSQVKVAAPNDPKETLKGRLDIVVEDSKLDIIAYPNPAENYFNVKVTGGNKETVEIGMYDMTGKLVQMERGASDQTYRFGDKVAGSMYIIQVRQGGQIATTRVVKL